MMDGPAMDCRIHTERLTLREFTTDDVDAAFALVGDDRVTAWLSFDSRTRDAARAMVEGVIDRRRKASREEYYLAVVTNEVDTVVGFVRLGMTGVRAAKLGYAVAADHWGRGYAREATGAVIDFGFRELGLHRISAAIGPENSASIKIADSTGMAYEGRIRDHVFTNGRWRDSLLYAVLDEEWTSRHPAVGSVGPAVRDPTACR